MNKKINIGIIGYGTVGSNTALILRDKKVLFNRRTGIEFQVKKICDVDWKTKRGWMPPVTMRTSDYVDIIEDPDIDVVVSVF
ncbi:MAG TPA: homoserine dehydrogenase, partial [bacterium]|nr:homoserine dehydrogenase [bacterium]